LSHKLALELGINAQATRRTDINYMHKFTNF